MVNLKRNIRETEGLNCESQLLHKSLTLAKEQIEKKNLLSIWNTLCKNLTLNQSWDLWEKWQNRIIEKTVTGAYQRKRVFPRVTGLNRVTCGN